MIDWGIARSTAGAFIKPGPNISDAEVDEVVAELREDAAKSEGPVREFTRMRAASASAPVLVVDRHRWVEANLATFEQMTGPMVTKIRAANKRQGRIGRTIAESLGGAEVGGLMAFMSSKVLGQFDPFYSAEGAEGGRLMLVAPNIVEVERKLEVDPHDFRWWVCLHEETHRVQFTAVPWLGQHLKDQLDRFVEATDFEAAALQKFLGEGLGEFGRIVRGESDSSLSDLFQNEQQKAVVERITGVMSLLEGHADVVMDGVGPEVIPSVAEIRRKFTARRRGGSPLNQAFRRLMGLEAKMRQYRDGAVFVRKVTDRVGRDGFNAVWESPENLPSKAEILDPALWVARVHG